MSLREISAVPTKRGIVGDLAISPSGEHVLALHGGFRGTNWQTLYAASFVDDAHGARPAPAFGRPAFALDDGRAFVLDVELTEIHVVLVEPDGVVVRKGIAYGSVSLLGCGRIDAGRIMLGVEDRDDGHGWSEPVYTETWMCVDIATGEHTDADPNVARTRRGPGTPFVTTNQRGPFSMPTLPFLAEWPIALGHACFLTDKRVFDASTGDARLALAAGWFEDLSRDEHHALAVTPDGALEIWSIAESRCVDRVAREGDRIESARFAAAREREIVVGTRGGDVVRYAWEP